MYKIRKIGIRIKFMALVISIVVITTILFSYATVTELLNIKLATRLSNEELGYEAAAKSVESLQELAVKGIMAIADGNTSAINEKLANWQNNVMLFSNHMTYIYSNPDEFIAIPIPPIDIKNKGIPTLQAAYAEGVTYESIKEEADLLSSSKHVMDSLFAGDINFLTVYFGTESGFLLSYDEDTDPKNENRAFDPRQRDWYELAKARNEVVFTPLTDDYYERGLVVTAAAPFWNANGEFAGVCAIDIAVDNLSNAIMDTKVGENGFVFWVDNNGRIVSNNPLMDDIKYKTFNEIYEIEPEFSACISRLMSEKDGYEKVTVSGKEVFVFYRFLGETSWGYGVVMPVATVVESASKIKSSIDRLTAKAQDDLSAKIVTYMFTFALLFVLVLIFAILLSIRYSNKLTEPILKLADGVNKISRLNVSAEDSDIGHLGFDSEINVKTGDEIESLADNFNIMTKRLNDYIINLAKVTADKERIATELSVATEIQASMLPCIFPPFPDRTEFEIYASMNPAKEVGGDFYDFFFIDEDRLAIVIADVSGKGIPAALFMVIAKTLIKNHASLNSEPEQVFSTVNNMLCENNSAFMFVTAFFGIYNIKTKMFTFTNAGHNPPVIRRKGQDFQYLTQLPGFVLAGFPDFEYTAEQIRLESGDMLFLYTDGVTEAMDPAHQIFTEARLLEALNKNDGLPLKDMLKNIREEIDNFALDEPQADDITMLALEIC